MNQSLSVEPVAALLRDDEPTPFRTLNETVEKPMLVVCDHASSRIPAALGDLGLDPLTLSCHLSHDIGAGPVSEMVATALGVTGIFCGYSRLVIDCNRDLLDSGAFLAFGDGTVIHGNRNLSKREKDRRVEAIYRPYHREIDAQIDRLQAASLDPLFISIHSFTPVMDGDSRPWQMGILWDADETSARFIIDHLRNAGYHVGDNEPYSGKAPQDYTIDTHAEGRGLAHVAIEVRQDLITHTDGQQRVAAVLTEAFRDLAEESGRTLG